MQDESKSQGRELDKLLGVSSHIASLKKEILLVAPLKKESVLIVGETGTGKELVARAIHDESRRTGGLLTINCNAFAGSTELVESELFGYKQGAFTGARKNKEGTLKAAGKGTVFLDEIGDLPLLVQGKLLRAIEYGVIRPVGSSIDEKIECRFIAATNKVSDKTYNLRPDLFYRFEHRITTTPLRDCYEDAVTLFLHFADQRCKELGCPEFTELPFSIVHQLLTYAWPGNVRELRSQTRDWVLHQAPQSDITFNLLLVGVFEYLFQHDYFDSRWLGHGLRLHPVSWAISTIMGRDKLVEWRTQALDPMAWLIWKKSYWMDRLIGQALAAESRLLTDENTSEQERTRLLNEGEEYWDKVRASTNDKPTAPFTMADLFPSSPTAATGSQVPAASQSGLLSPEAFSIGFEETIASLVTRYCQATTGRHGNQTEAATSLGITRATLRKYLKGAKIVRLR